MNRKTVLDGYAFNEADSAHSSVCVSQAKESWRRLQGFACGSPEEYGYRASRVSTHSSDCATHCMVPPILLHSASANLQDKFETCDAPRRFQRRRVHGRLWLPARTRVARRGAITAFPSRFAVIFTCKPSFSALLSHHADFSSTHRPSGQLSRLR
jgi:hypothetical protein